MPFEALRARFPGLQDKTFLDAACVSLAPADALEALSNFGEMAVFCGARDASQHHIAMDKRRFEAVPEIAKLTGADARHIALVESTTHGLSVAAAAIQPEPGSNVLIPDTEFMQVAIPWRATRTLKDVALKPVRSRDGGVFEVEDFEAAMDERTRVVCVSSVQWCTGVRLDMRGLGELCRARGVWLVADAIQELGAMAVDTRDRYADFLIAGGHKWLNAPFGCGLMVVSDRVLEELAPPAYGYLSTEEPEGGWAEYFRTPSISPYTAFRPVHEARAYELGGTANYPGAVGLSASLRLINQIGIERAEARIRHLSERLRQGLLRVNAKIISPENPAMRSGITVFQMYDSPAENLALAEHLIDKKVYISVRYTSGLGGIRVSTHFYNNEKDIDHLLSALGQAMGRRPITSH